MLTTRRGSGDSKVKRWQQGGAVTGACLKATTAARAATTREEAVCWEEKKGAARSGKGCDRGDYDKGKKRQRRQRRRTVVARLIWRGPWHRTGRQRTSLLLEKIEWPRAEVYSPALPEATSARTGISRSLSEVDKP
ncbi:hypothetical protein B296_00046968 [Ensete ventricosum]|uniref:Uncharacterized protein n=1 Tax=Ensete ventricosum TaxID=4639 RepID=A0A426YSP0_ENSVE|nr:hypothetical protein B296_00046968 [Ensete ventricosum]